MATQVQMGSRAKQFPLEKMVFRKTGGRAGRHIFVSPSNSAMRHLAYGRIVLDASRAKETFSNGSRETGLVCVSGEAEVTVDGDKIVLGKHDAIYIPRDSSIQVTTKTAVDLAEFSSDVEHRYPLQVVRAAEIAKDPGLEFSTGTDGCKRHIHMLLAKNVEAGRLVIGFTQAEPGNWTSWPPHEHAELLEELYVYFDMPAPSFGIQLVYNNADEPELVTTVHDGDAVLMPSGYHPNVSVPGYSICFLWAMAAHREVEGRQFGVVTVQPGFDRGATGLEAGRKK
jgi:5-deoxy-glucuronate isomerase